MNEANHDAANDAANPSEVVSPSPAAVRVVKGNPSDEEIAALVTVLTAAQGGSESTGDSRPRELWGSPELLHRRFAPQSAYSFAASGRYPR
ncbi:acyl-CoA carboxylase subunit epsilon [Rhodococcus sp. IEGM 1370]|uniref:acyl-CoA carboxylase subunit epsilon n=1 Tax=unclassified Rhodococcus (in: high G+C Gram-positive bacteria) TaxID=192944 RepID=UPI0011EEF696|nr:MULTISPECIES: acyl-CoA carboxylase subunit epsilon [unclassified Rhodococcus (in: high G+C Gram-positive bacteria)]KAA0928273.1 acyl-CoA carboxylase subunit epsilon [Rhodococcus sp. ANT_H53B]MDV8075650.1 acyl-CoA carboxylase subunit epsilon [Rhodococcus sp. IEGM 1370]